MTDKHQEAISKLEELESECEYIYRNSYKDFAELFTILGKFLDSDSEVVIASYKEAVEELNEANERIEELEKQVADLEAKHAER